MVVNGALGGGRLEEKGREQNSGEWKHQHLAHLAYFQ